MDGDTRPGVLLAPQRSSKGSRPRSLKPFSYDLLSAGRTFGWRSMDFSTAN
jgi:hypothetical protein